MISTALGLLALSSLSTAHSFGSHLTTRDVASPRLALAVDTTGSMGGYVGAMLPELKRILNTKLGTPDEPSSFLLSPFNDPRTGPITNTSSYLDFGAALDVLSFGGGGDCPEMSLTGILSALQSLPDRDGGNLFVVTDASAKDASIVDAVISAAVQTNVRVFFLLFDNICGTGEPVYDQIARATGGQVLNDLQLADAGPVTELINFLTVAGREEIIRVFPDSTVPTVDLTGGRVVDGRRVRSLAKRDPFAATVRFSVDLGTTSLVVSVDGGSAVTVTGPTNDANTQSIALTRGVIDAIANPTPGIWTVSVADCDACSVSISGVTAVRISSFGLFQTLVGSTAEELITAAPVIGCLYRAEATLEGAVTDVVFELRKANGDLISTIPMVLTSGLYAADLLIPTDPFMVYIRARDSAGNVVVRVYPRLITGVAGSGSCENQASISSVAGTPSSSVGAPVNSNSASAVSNAASNSASNSASDFASNSASATNTGVAVSASEGSVVAVSTAAATVVSNSALSSALGSVAGATAATQQSATAVAAGALRGTVTVEHTAIIELPCNKPSCHHDGNKQAEYEEESVTTVEFKWTTTCPDLVSITRDGRVAVETRLSTITRIMSVESLIPCAKCVGENYPVTTTSGSTPRVGENGQLSSGEGEGRQLTTTTNTTLGLAGSSAEPEPPANNDPFDPEEQPLPRPERPAPGAPGRFLPGPVASSLAAPPSLTTGVAVTGAAGNGSRTAVVVTGGAVQERGMKEFMLAQVYAVVFALLVW
ncbi:hypothetical protein QBC47DRAFT_363530 [Echria macrotheca]|uniref:Hemicentin-1-like von Willebrand factor A domain-containing protein n=1 Tax=Echria macrotheca TaxID=438768 RepID=A0AAJ0F3Z1_9PEZI|nr:hypothetical protein QBC47DRAFT_363530 [Echria macrotheca]